MHTAGSSRRLAGKPRSSVKADRNPVRKTRGCSAAVVGSEVWASGVAYEPFAQFRHGDLLARMVGDVDAIQDLSLRVLQPCGCRELCHGP